MPESHRHGVTGICDSFHLMFKDGLTESVRIEIRRVSTHQGEPSERLEIAFYLVWVLVRLAVYRGKHSLDSVTCIFVVAPENSQRGGK